MKNLTTNYTNYKIKNIQKVELLYKNEVYNIVGAAMEVRRILGHCFPEAVYQEALAIEFGLQDIPFVEQPRLNLKFKGHLLKCFYKPDYLCYEEIIVEIKSISKCGPSEKGNSSML